MEIRKILDFAELNLFVRVRKRSDQFFSQFLETFGIGKQFEYSRR